MVPHSSESLSTMVRKWVRGDSYDGADGGLSSLDMSAKADERAATTHARLMVQAALSFPPPPHTHGPIVVVSSYTQFSALAHGPRGTEASRGMRTAHAARRR